jgi:polysaccharide biosynthesis protein PelG
MAGIGFELKRLFAEKGILLNLRASLYASIVVAGPMLLGAIMLLGMNYIAILSGVSKQAQDLMVVIITYSILLPLIITSFVSFVSTRYVADVLYENQNERVLPSMYGAISLCLPVGALFWIIFLAISRLPLLYSIFSFMLFCEATVVWIQLTYINAAKDYARAVLGFGLGIFTGILVGYLFAWVLHLETVSALLAAVCIAYGIMIISFTVVLHGYFPVGSGSSLKFLEWVEKYPSLVFVGFFTTAGLFVHMFLMWAGPWGEKVTGMFYHAPAYDIPALLGMLTTLVTSVRFVTSVELNFYPKYRLYFSLLNNGSNLSNLNKAGEQMKTVLKQELFYLAQIQLTVEIAAIVLAGGILPRIGMGFTPVMLGVFRVLSVGYGLYAIGNSMVLFLLYLSDYRDAMIASITLFVASGVATIITLALPEFFYGFGFVIASLLMFFVAWIRLSSYINRLDYNIFCRQPIFIKEQNGWLTRLARRLDRAQS